MSATIERKNEVLLLLVIASFFLKNHIFLKGFFCQVFHLSQLVYVGQLKKVPITLFVKWKNRISHGTEAAQAQRSRFRPRPHSTKPKTTNIQLPRQ